MSVSMPFHINNVHDDVYWKCEILESLLFYFSFFLFYFAFYQTNPRSIPDDERNREPRNGAINSKAINE